MTRTLPRSSQQGGVNILAIPLILVVLLFLGSAVFAVWAFNSREDYRTNSDQKVAAAVKIAKQQEDAVKDKAYAEADKQPLKLYSGPEQSGSVRVSYPKTWSGYVDDTSAGNQPLDGYYQPGAVPSLTNQGSTFALRVQVVSQSYSTVITAMKSAVTTKQVTATAYAFPRVANVVGVRYDGSILQGKKITGSMVVVPIRDKTLKVWTESPVYAPDFNNNILPNVSFSP